MNLYDYIGKPIVVNFWATWCGPCRTELPAFNKIYKEYSDKIEFLMVNLTDGYDDTEDEVKKFVKDNEYEFPVYFDIKYSATDAYKISSIPKTIFIDVNGNIVYSKLGAMSEETIRKYIESIIEK